jgi:acyl-[acyl-carrier-protein]-phospholipid O-acyltransferase/long-chain-fatty-acid--[acyl-carrier-protein] ligase
VLEPPEEGWYDTGDIVEIDADGYVAIKGRAKRFAKIAGEMVSLASVEALASDLWPDAATAVVARPDPRKGERLILVTTKQGATRSEFLTLAKSRHAADLMIPQDVMIVDAIPLLGSGKTDYPALQKLVDARETA